jgi:hypothetical protein
MANPWSVSVTKDGAEAFGTAAPSADRAIEIRVELDHYAGSRQHFFADLKRLVRQIERGTDKPVL